MPGQAPPPPSGETSPLNLVPLDALIAILDMKATADKGFFSAAQKAEVLAQVRLAIKTLEEAKMLDADFNAVVTDPQKTAMRTLQSQGIFKKLQEKNLPMSAVNLAPIVLANLQK